MPWDVYHDSIACRERSCSPTTSCHRFGIVTLDLPCHALPAVVLDFDEGTPVAVSRLLLVVEGSRGRIRLTNPSTLEVRTRATDPFALVAEIRDVLRSLESA